MGANKLLYIGVSVWWWCVIVAADKTIVKGKKLGTGEEFRFDALQCDSARTLARYSGRRFCSIDKIRQENGLLDKGPSSEYGVLQYNPTRKFKAIKCEKRVSTLTAVCGAFSHSKLVEPPDVLKPVKIPKQDCIDAASTKLITTEDGRQLRAGMGVVATYKYVETGTVVLSENNVACEGGEMKVKGKKHESIVELVTVNFKITEIEVSEELGKLRTSEGSLPRQCSLEYEGCVLDDMTLVIDLTKVNLCQYTQVRRAKFKLFRTEGRDMAQNDEYKLLFQLGGKRVIPNACSTQGTLLKTNFDRLFLLSADTAGNSLSMFNPSDVDLDLEARVADFYMEYWSLELVRENTAAWQNEMCTLSASRLNEDQVIIHGDHLLRMKGELVNEFKCNWVTVTASAAIVTGKQIGRAHV